MLKYLKETPNALGYQMSESSYRDIYTDFSWCLRQLEMRFRTHGMHHKPELCVLRELRKLAPGCQNAVRIGISANLAAVVAPQRNRSLAAILTFFVIVGTVNCISPRLMAPLSFFFPKALPPELRRSAQVLARKYSESDTHFRGRREYKHPPNTPHS